MKTFKKIFKLRKSNLAQTNLHIILTTIRYINVDVPDLLNKFTEQSLAIFFKWRTKLCFASGGGGIRRKKWVK